MYCKSPLREGCEEKRGNEDAERMVPANQSNGDSQKARAARESIFVIVLVAEDVVDPADSRDHARKREPLSPSIKISILFLDSSNSTKNR